MNGFGDQNQRSRVCSIIAGWLTASGCNFEPMHDGAPSELSRYALNAHRGPKGNPLSKSQMTTLRLLHDMWNAEGGTRVVDLCWLDKPERARVGLLIEALANGPAVVDAWIIRWDGEGLATDDQHDNYGAPTPATGRNHD